ncbi:hypothetical protein QOZ80_5BG0421280 [Eleusine coracana subsp. coracana]|nr:hypothetical protein QOZ80_5BG0421280 [Eleusine coracana subsp. coracana]
MAWPPELIDDATTEIFLRLPPDEPAHLVRAAVVCTSWRGILTDPTFLRRYRAFHGAPPLLGFLDVSTGPDEVVPSFTPTVQASPFPHQTLDCVDWRTLDCRHGRVLFGLYLDTDNLVVWDPITGVHQELPIPCIARGYYTAAVFCSVRGCDHLNCHGGPFCVVLTGISHDASYTMWAHLYSSEAGAWIASTHLDPRPPGESLVLIHPPKVPYSEGGMILLPVEGDSLGLASISGSRLSLWSTNVNPEGIAGWVQCRDIELMTGFSFMANSIIYIVGSIEGMGIIFVATEFGRFAIDLKSGQERKVDEPGINDVIFPFMSFYTPDCTSSKLPVLTMED